MRDVRSFSAAVALVMVLMAPGRARAQAAVAFTPGIGTIPDGVSLNVTPAVSADRRYVRLSVGVGFQTVDGFQTIPFPGAAVGGAGAGGLGARRGAGGLFNVFDEAWSPDLGVPYALDYRPRPTRPLKARTSGPKKTWADPVIVPIKKAEARAAVAPRN